MIQEYCQTTEVILDPEPVRRIAITYLGETAGAATHDEMMERSGRASVSSLRGLLGRTTVASPFKRR